MKKIILILFIVLITLLTGCKSVSHKTLLSKIIVNMNQQDNYQMIKKYNIDTSDIDMTLTTDMHIDMKTKDIGMLKYDTNFTIDLSGFKTTQIRNTYLKVNEENVEEYSKASSTSKWVKTTIETKTFQGSDQDLSRNIEYLGKLKHYNTFELIAKKKLAGKEIYIYHLTIDDLTLFIDLFGEDFLPQLGIDKVNIKDLAKDIIYKVTINPTLKLILNIEIDMKQVFKESINEIYQNNSIEQALFTIEIKNIGKTDVKIPESVINNENDDGHSLEVIY